MVNHLDGDAARFRLRKGTGSIAVQARPGIFIDFSFECSFQSFIRVIRAEKIGVAHEEAFFVVVRIDEPAGDSVRGIAANLARRRIEDVYTFDFHLNLAVFRVKNVDVRLAENHEQIAFAGILQIAGHVQVGVHPRLQHRDAAELIELGRMGVVVEGAGYEHVEAGIGGFARGLDEIGP